MPRRLVSNDPVAWCFPNDIEKDGSAKSDATIYGIVAFTEGDAKTISMKPGGNITGLADDSQNKVLMRCVRWLKNVAKPNGEILAFTENKVEIEQILSAHISTDTSRLALACMFYSYLDEGAIKNSGASPASPHS